jgi:SAM-dependent methyltransferase
MVALLVPPHPLDVASAGSLPSGSSPSGSLPAAAGDLAGWNQALNRTHAMAALRARGGRIVRAIEARRRELVASRVRARRPRCVVDVGCEDGWLAEAYADGLSRLLLVDLDPAMLAGSALAGRPGVATVVADALEPAPIEAALGEARADVLVLSALLEHLPAPGRALDALAPLVARHGVMVVYVPADGPILLAKRLLKVTRLGGLVKGLSLEPAPGHVQRFTRQGLAALLQPRGRILELAFDPVALGYVAVLAPHARAGR